MNTDRGKSATAGGTGLITPIRARRHDRDREQASVQPDAPAGTRLREFPAERRTHTVVLVLHGGRARSTAKTRPWQLAYARMIPFAHAAYRALPDGGTAVWLLRNRVRGWNEPRMDPMIDARNTLAEIRREHPGVEIVLVGHSMGARTALRLAGEESVIAVCALAPWIEPGEPVEQLAGRSVLIAHGDRDFTTSARASSAFAARAQQAGNDVRYTTISRSGHAMLRRARVWTDLVRDFVVSTRRGAPDDRPEADQR